MFLDSLDNLERSIDRESVDPRFHYVYEGRLLTMLTISLFINVVIFAIIAILVNNRPPAEIYLSSVAGNVTKIVPQQEPILTRGTVAEWSRDALKTVYNLNHLEYAAQLASAQKYFSADAWRLFMEQFDAKIKPELVGKQLLIAAVPAAAVVVSEGMLNGVQSWIVQVPVETTWSGATGSELFRMMVNLTVSKSPDDPRGIVITQFAADRANTNK